MVTLSGGYHLFWYPLLPVGHCASSYDDAVRTQGHPLQEHLGLRRQDHPERGYLRHVQGTKFSHLKIKKKHDFSSGN